METPWYWDNNPSLYLLNKSRVLARVAKIGNCKIWGRPNLKGRPQFTQISTINMYKFIKIRHDILIKCHGNCMEKKKFNYMLEIDIFRNSSQKKWVSWGFVFKGLGVQKDTQTPCWLRPWIWVFTVSWCKVLSFSAFQLKVETWSEQLNMYEP